MELILHVFFNNFISKFRRSIFKNRCCCTPFSTGCIFTGQKKSIVKKVSNEFDKKNFTALFYWWSSIASRLEPLRGGSLFLAVSSSLHRNPWYLFYRPRKDERLIRPWRHPVVLNTGPLDWESSVFPLRTILLHLIRKLPSNDSFSKFMKNAFYFIEKAYFVLEIFNVLYFCLPTFFSLSAIALEADQR